MSLKWLQLVPPLYATAELAFRAGGVFATAKDAGGNPGRFTVAAADVVFVRACDAGRSSLDFAGFLRAVAMAAAARGETFEKISQIILTAAARLGAAQAEELGFDPMG